MRETVLYNVLKNKINKSVVMGSCLPSLQVTDSTNLLYHLHTTGGHFACACVNPLNDNSVGASNLMAGNRKLARKITVLLKAISLVL